MLARNATKLRANAHLAKTGTTDAGTVVGDWPGSKCHVNPSRRGPE